jgi:hypothetical protein
MAVLGQETLSFEKLSEDAEKKFMDKVGINEIQLAKIEQVFKDGLGIHGTIDKDFSIDIKNGQGKYEYSTKTYGVTVDGYITINEPKDGTWHFIAKDGREPLFDEDGIKLPWTQHIHYKTGFSVDLVLTAIWSNKSDGTLKGHLHLDYGY